MESQIRNAIVAIIVVIPLAIFVIWYQDSPSEQLLENHEKPIVLTSFYPLYEFTREIGGDRILVSMVTPANVEPHDWDPTIKDIQQIQKADALVINGVGFEQWVDKIDPDTSNLYLIDSSNGINFSSYAPELAGDPHIWLDPVLVQKQIENIENGLKVIDPKNSIYYSTNANKLKSQIVLLDQKIKNELADCKKDFIAFHDAFSYFSKRYGLNQHAIVQSNSHSSTTTPHALEKIIDLAKRNEIHVIFVEEGVDTRAAQTIANEIDADVLVLSPLEISLDGKNYLEKMEQNLFNLKVALCQ